MDWHGFIVAMFPIALSPGASFTLAISNASIAGFRGVFKVILGTGFGIILHGVFVGLGISSFIVKDVILLRIITLVGTAFLFYLGVKLLISGLKLRVRGPTSDEETSFQKAFLLNIFNVKAILFYLTVVPIFGGVNFVSYLYLSSLHVLVMSVWTAICGYLFITAQKNISFAKVSVIVNIIGGICLVYLSYIFSLSLNN